MSRNNWLGSAEACERSRRSTSSEIGLSVFIARERNTTGNSCATRMKCQAQNEIVDCRRCDRLVRYREQVARQKVRRFQNWEYWGRPVPSLGPLSARLLVVGLAPAAHGGNRTGRVF